MNKDIIRMANDIANNCPFKNDEAYDFISEHINKFWPLPMRQRLHELFNDNPTLFNYNIAHSISKIKCNVHNPITAEFKDKTGTGG